MPPTRTPEHDLTPALLNAISQSRKLFNSAAGELRPRLHRFCSRMCGSSLDGEDVVQETLAEAFYGLSTLKDASRFEPWLFRIAYHKCIDHLRREKRRDSDVALDDEHDRANDSDDASVVDAPIDEALAMLVGELPPKERAAVLLKDVLDYSLNEIAEIADSTLGGVKAALHRARAKLHARPAPPVIAELDVDQRRLFEAYAECFNRRDWEALRNLVAADARLEIVGASEGRMAELGATYSGNYTNLPWEWHLSVGLIDGETVIVHSRRSGSEWQPHTAIRLWWRDGRVVRIRDYIHVEYLLSR
ncbi:MAG: sigma-70 family RNA polymerase sigma factor [Gemmatimonadota bacterium]|nr:sigma-70 family RNA polymerase sigma factor [Gemmatimonadota bacterium]